MKTLPPFHLHRPKSLEEATRALAEHAGECRVIAGGTDLVVNLRDRIDIPEHVVSVGAIDELQGIDRDPASSLRLGALSTIREISMHRDIRKRFPVLARAAESVSGPTLRAMGTLGGNLCLDTRCHWFNQSFEWRRGCGFCLKKDGDICHVAKSSSICVATSCGDLAPALLTLGATVTLVSARGSRELALDEFYVDDGTHKFVLEPDEILTEVRVPAAAAGRRGFFGKLRARAAIDYPLASVAVSGSIDGEGRFENTSIALSASGPRPVLLDAVSELVNGRAADEETIRGAAEIVYRAANPLKTGGLYSPGYRRLRTRLYARDGLREIAGLKVDERP